MKTGCVGLGVVASDSPRPAIAGDAERPAVCDGWESSVTRAVEGTRLLADDIRQLRRELAVLGGEGLVLAAKGRRGGGLRRLQRAVVPA